MMFRSGCRRVQLFLVILILPERGSAGIAGTAKRVGGWVAGHTMSLLLRLRKVESRVERMVVVSVEVVGVGVYRVRVVVAQEWGVTCWSSRGGRGYSRRYTRPYMRGLKTGTR